MKYFLFLWVCSAINGSCMTPAIQKPQPFNSHYECVSVGYLDAMKMVHTMGEEIVEKNRFFVAFNCKPASSI